jgi:multidrug resistance efflux pump
MLAASCDTGNDEQIPLYKVIRGDFERSIEIDGFVEPVNSTVISCPPRISGTVAFLVEDGLPVKQGDLLFTIESTNLQTQYDQVMQNLETYRAELAKTRADLDMQFALLEAEVKNNDASIKISELDTLQLQYLTPNQSRIKQLELEQVKIRKAVNEKKLKNTTTIHQSEIRTKEIQIQQFERQEETFRKQIEDLDVRAPKDGIAIRSVSQMTGLKLKASDQIYGGMPMIILPENTGMKVVMQIPEADFRGIEMNDSVSFTFDAMPSNTGYGKITKKAAVASSGSGGGMTVLGGGSVIIMRSGSQQQSKVKFYEVEALIDSAALMPEPGYSADCHIVMDIVSDTLFVPLIAVFEVDSMKVVYVKSGRRFEMRQVETGFSSIKETLITKGLEGNESIALIKPKKAKKIEQKSKEVEKIEEKIEAIEETSDGIEAIEQKIEIIENQ